MLMSAEVRGCITWFMHDLFFHVKYNCAKFHHCRICVTDFREGWSFLQKIVVKKLQKGNMYLKSDSSLRNHKHFIIISVFGKWQTISILKMMKNELMKCRNRADSGYKERDRLTKTWATAEMALKLSDGFLKRAFHIFLFLRPCFTTYNYNIIEATTWGVIWKKLFLEIS